MGGIRTDEKNPGYKHIFIEPQIPESVTWAKTTKESPYGTIAVNWSLESGKLNMDIALPVGCTATVILPQNTRDYKLNGKNGRRNSNTVSIENGNSKITATL